jgi:hypothetical protein
VTGVQTCALPISAALAAGAAPAAIVAATYAGLYIGMGVAYAGISLGLGKISSALAGRPKLGDDLRSRTFTVRSSIAYRTILYGSARTGGTLVYANTAGLSNQYQDFVVAIAGHEIAAITDVWFDDVKIAEADINDGLPEGGPVEGAGKYRERDGEPVAWIYKYLGTETQLASSVLDALNPEWTTDHRLRGCAYVHIRLRRHFEVYERGPPQNFTFGYRGAKVYDPRLDSTNGGSGAHRIADPSTWEYSDNWALCVADYLIGGTVTNAGARVNWRGFDVDPSSVVWATVIEAANISDELVWVSGDGETRVDQARYTVGGALSTGNVPVDNLERLLTAGLGQVVPSSSGYRLYAGAYMTPTLSLTEDDLVGEVSLIADTPRADRYNAVGGTRWDTETGTEVEFLPRTDPAYEAEDGAQIFRNIELPFTTDEYRAQRIGQIILRRSREQETITMHCNPGALRVGVWMTVAVTCAELGIGGKVYRCLMRDENEDQTITLTLREEYPETYTDPITADYGDLTPANPQPTPADYLDAPIGLVAVPTSDGIQFTITPHPAARTGTVYELFEHSEQSPFAAADLIRSAADTNLVVPRTSREPGYFWVRARFGPRLSDVYPSGNGVSAYAATPYRRGLVPDPEFETGDLSLWGKQSLVSYQTGGMYAGMARLRPNGSSIAEIGTAPLPAATYGTAAVAALFGTWTIKVTVRYRVQTALTGPNKRLTVFVGYKYKSLPTRFSTGQDYINLTSAVVGTWYEGTVTVQYVGVASATHGGPLPIISALLYYTEVTGGVLDIDYFHAEVIG